MSISPLAGEYTIIDKTFSLPRHPSLTYHPRDVRQLRWIAIHHTAGPADQSPEDIAAFHVNVRGWSGIGYTFLVYEPGRWKAPPDQAVIVKGRPMGVVPACVQGQNTVCVCMAFVGDFSLRSPAPDALYAGAWLARHLRRTYPWILGVKGHGEFMATQCPGTKFPLAEFRTLVATGIT